MIRQLVAPASVIPCQLSTITTLFSIVQLWYIPSKHPIPCIEPLNGLVLSVQLMIVFCFIITLLTVPFPTDGEVLKD